MRILVAGGTGFIGTHLCHELFARGHEVTALSRSPASGDLPADVETVDGDVTAYDSIVDAVEGSDAVVNLVALSPLFRPVGGEERQFDVHLGGTRNLVRAATDHGVGTFLQLSAIGADPDGETAHIQAKGRAEAVVRESSLEWIVVRPSVVFGDGEEFIPAVKQLAPPYLTPLPGGGRTRFQPIWIDDLVGMLADATEGTTPVSADDDFAVDGSSSSPSAADTAADGHAAAANPHAGETYELGGPEVLTLAEVARLAHAADGRPVRVLAVPMGLAGIGLAALDRVPASILDALPGVPRMGVDQYRSLRFDNTTSDSDVGVFGIEPGDLTTIAEYLGVDPLP